MAFLFMNPMYHCCPRTMDPIHKPRPLLENRPEPSFTAPKPAPFTPLKQDPFQEHLNKNVFQQSNPSYTPSFANTFSAKIPGLNQQPHDFNLPRFDTKKLW